MPARDGGPEGWRFGDKVEPSERRRIIAAFNGAFRLSYTDTGFAAGGHVADPLRAGLASVVTYTNGISDIGAWGIDVPSAAVHGDSVLQNQTLLPSTAAHPREHLRLRRRAAGRDDRWLNGWPARRSEFDARGDLIWAAARAPYRRRSRRRADRRRLRARRSSSTSTRTG